jgi:hypothetical protein
MTKAESLDSLALPAKRNLELDPSTVDDRPRLNRSTVVQDIAGNQVFDALDH